MAVLGYALQHCGGKAHLAFLLPWLPHLADCRIPPCRMLLFNCRLECHHLQGQHGRVQIPPNLLGTPKGTVGVQGRQNGVEGAAERG